MENKGIGMRIIVYGAGIIGQRIIKILSKEHQIIGLCDSDEKKWGLNIGGYKVYEPNEIQKFDTEIVISTPIYAYEIVEKLKSLGINEERIFFVMSGRSRGKLFCSIYPLCKEMLSIERRELKSYDILNANTREGTIKVLIGAEFYSVYTKQLVEKIDSYFTDIELTILTWDEETKDRINAKCLSHIYCYKSMSDLMNILNQLQTYDVAQLLWIERDWVYLTDEIRDKTRRLNLNIGGSDFYRASNYERENKRYLIEKADYISGETNETINDFVEYYGEEYRSKTVYLPFGVQILELISEKINSHIDKKNIYENFKLDNEKIVITCGHNAIAEHQHLKILEQISKLSETTKKKIQLSIPMTYPLGREIYIQKVRDAAEKLNIRNSILTDFMDFDQMAEYSIISDIMIHIQTTDQLSSSMIEEMYSGSIVIAGNWLPYNSLRENGVFFLSINSVDELAPLLEDVIANLDWYKGKCRQNKKAIWEISSWEKIVPRWRAMWNPIEGD